MGVSRVLPRENKKFNNMWFVLGGVGKNMSEINTRLEKFKSQGKKIRVFKWWAGVGFYFKP